MIFFVMKINIFVWANSTEFFEKCVIVWSVVCSDRKYLH